jgi:glycosyltransferase involved in cell wall biosynthesis
MKVLILAVKEKGGRHNRWIGPLKAISGITGKSILKSRSYIPFFFRALWETYRFKPHIIMSIGPDLLGINSILINKLVSHGAVIVSLGGDPITVRLDLLTTMNKRQIAGRYKHKLLCYLNLHYVFKNCSYFMVNSHYLRNQLLLNYHHFKNKNIYVIPQPMPLGTGPRRKAIRTANRCIRLLTVTNLAYRAKYHGVLELVDFLRKYAGQNRFDYRLVFDIYGGGNLENHLRKKLETKAGIQDKLSIRFHGFVEHLQSIYKMAHLFLYSSNLDSLPRVLLEAQAAGLPILVNDFEPFREVVRNGYNGLLYKSGDFDDFQAKLHMLVTNRHLRHSLGKHSLENLKGNYSFHAIGAKLESSFSKVLFPNREDGEALQSSSCS